MALKVSTMKLILPIIMMIILIAAAVIVLNNLDVEQSTTGYNYKEKLFNEDIVGTIEITVSENNWQKILDDPTAEEYVEASINVNGEVYNNVGIRAKGNSSLSSVASSDSERYSLKVDFAQYDSNQTFYGLEKINLNNNFSDTTQMKEFVSYELMEQLGIVTPAHSYVKVNVNGEYYGLMLAVEEIGEAYAKSNYGSTEGFIFKPEDDGSDLAYVSDDKSNYSGIFNEVKMNKKTAENNSNVINMMKEISEGDTSSLDVDQIARYFALNTALVNMDSYQGSFKHNYYLYENGEGTFSIIPWDYNMAFGGFNMGGGGGPQGNVSTASGNEQNVEAGENTEEAVKNELNGETTPPDNTNGQMTPPNGANGQMTPPNAANGQTTSPNAANGQMQRPTANSEQNENGQNNDTQQNENQRANRPGMNGGGMGGGGGMMLDENIVTDSSVNFSITEPVSGTTVEARPLLKIILENEEARALYDGYLEKIATEILTEENVLAITTKLQDLLLDAVDEDPSKFATTEQFIAGVSGEQSLPEFAKQRSESILKQLSGEIEGVSGASTGFGGGEMNGQMPNMNGEMPEMNGQMPNMPEMNGEMPEMNGQQPNFENMPEMNGEMPNMPGMGQGEQQPTNAVEDTKQTIILLTGSIFVILLAIAIVHRLSNRKYSKGLKR